MEIRRIITRSFSTALCALIALPVQAAGGEARSGRPVANTCLDAEEIVILDDVEMSVDTEAEDRNRRRAERKRRRLRAEVQRQEDARRQAEARAAQAEAALAAEAEARAQSERERDAAAAEAMRRVVRLEALAAVAGKDAHAAGVALRVAASTHRDPVLWVEAAERFADAFDQGHPADFNQALSAATEAKRDAEGAATDEQERADVVTRADAILAGLPQRQRQRSRSERLARVELATGGSLLAMAGAGFAMLGGGAYLLRAADAERARVEGIEGIDTSPLVAQEHRGRALMIAGGVIGTAGAVFGGTMLGLGLRDLVRVGRRGDFDVASASQRTSGGRPRRDAAGAMAGAKRRGGARARLGPGPTVFGATLTLRM